MAHLAFVNDSIDRTPAKPTDRCWDYTCRSALVIRDDNSLDLITAHGKVSRKSSGDHEDGPSGLVSAGIQVLAEIALEAHQRDTDHGHAQIGSGSKFFAGQHAQAPAVAPRQKGDQGQ
jgi:hypothetical protein